MSRPLPLITSPPPPPSPCPVIQAPGESSTFKGVCPGQKVTPYRFLCWLVPKHMLSMTGSLILLVVLFKYYRVVVVVVFLPFKSDAMSNDDSFV